MKIGNFSVQIPVSGRVRICLDLLKQQGIADKVIVDIGSSFGWMEKKIENFGAKEIIGIEPDKHAVQFARKNVAKAKFIVGSVLQIPLVDHCADIVTVFDVIEHIPKECEQNALNEIYRILKKNGTLLLSTPNSHPIANILDLAWYFGHRHYSAKSLVKLLECTGFEIIDISPKGNIMSAFYLVWFYGIKKLFKVRQPRNKILEKLDDKGYDQKGIVDIFMVAKKK